MVNYKGSCDVFVKTYVWDADAGSMEIDWDYANPETIRCNVAELNPDNVQELFLKTGYQYTKTIKLETDVPLDLSSRIGNIRLDELVYDMVFNIDNVQPRIDWRGKIIGYRIICRSTNV